MRGADRIVVNSGFTRSMVESVWPGLAGEKNGRRDLGIVYPCVDTEEQNGQLAEKEQEPLWPSKKVILSINRFERKKDVGLAIKAFAGLTKETRQMAKLVVAGKSCLSVESIC